MDEKRDSLILEIQNIENAIFKIKKSILKLKKEFDIENERIKIYKKVVKKPLININHYNDNDFNNEDLCIEI